MKDVDDLEGLFLAVDRRLGLLQAACDHFAEIAFAKDGAEGADYLFADGAEVLAGDCRDRLKAIRDHILESSAGAPAAKERAAA